MQLYLQLGQNHLLISINPGRSEKEIRGDMADLFLERGIAATAFGGVIASGANSALPHYIGDSRILQKKDVLLLDFGCCYQGMNADTSRTVFLGAVSKQQLKVYKIVREANYQVEIKAVEGAYIPDICKAAQKVIDHAGYGEYFNHRLGHGIGYALHESPEIVMKNKQILKRGMAFTIEPGIYLENQFGVRIEDVVIINELGKTEILNKTSKEIIIV